MPGIKVPARKVCVRVSFAVRATGKQVHTAALLKVLHGEQGLTHPELELLECHHAGLAVVRALTPFRRLDQVLRV